MQLAFHLGLVLVHSLLTAAESMVGSWVMSGLFRSCDKRVEPGHTGPLCTHQFLIGESTDPKEPMTWCTVLAYSLDGVGRNTSFSGVPCLENGPAEAYRVSSHWHSAGLVTMAVVNKTKGVHVSFAFSDHELADPRGATSKIGPAYNLVDGHLDEENHRLAMPRMMSGGSHSWPNSQHVEHVTGRRLHPRNEKPDDSQQNCNPDLWVVRNLQRNARSVMQIVLFRFDLFRCDEVINCRLETMGINSTTVDIKYDNFANAPCENVTNINVSWGYKADTDGGIMTLKDLEQHRRAFLGWDNVNSRIKIEEEASGYSEVY